MPGGRVYKVSKSKAVAVLKKALGNAAKKPMSSRKKPAIRKKAMPVFPSRKASVASRKRRGNYSSNLTYRGSAFAPSVVTGNVRHTGQSHSTTIVHEEFVTDVYSSSLFAIPVGGGGQPDRQVMSPGYLNPLNPDLFPWLSSIARNFQMFKFLKLEFIFTSTSSNALASADTALGTISMGVNYNVNAADPTEKAEIQNLDGAAVCKPSSSMVFKVNCNPRNLVMDDLYCRAAEGGGNSGRLDNDWRFSCLGVFYLATVGMQLAGTNLGELRVRYVCRLMKPELPSSSEIPSSYALGFFGKSPTPGSSPIVWNGPFGTQLTRMADTFSRYAVLDPAFPHAIGAPGWTWLGMTTCRTDPGPGSNVVAFQPRRDQSQQIVEVEFYWQGSRPPDGSACPGTYGAQNPNNLFEFINCVGFSGGYFRGVSGYAPDAIPPPAGPVVPLAPLPFNQNTLWNGIDASFIVHEVNPYAYPGAFKAAFRVSVVFKQMDATQWFGVRIVQPDVDPAAGIPVQGIVPGYPYPRAPVAANENDLPQIGMLRARSWPFEYDFNQNQSGDPYPQAN